jgi:hypothetical protein
VTKLATFAALKNYQLWDVLIGNNYYNGRYADYNFRAYPVIAGSAVEDGYTVLKHSDAVLEDLKTKKYNHRRRMLPPRSALEINKNRIGTIEQRIVRSTAAQRWKTVISPEGWVDVQLAHSQIINWRTHCET